MSRKSNKPSPSKQLAVTASPVPGTVQAFTFGEPAPVLDRRELLDYIEAWSVGRWYEPPISLDGLAKSYRASPHHSSAIQVKRNVLVSTFKPHPKLSREDFSRLALDFLVLGNGYLERRKSVTGRSFAFKHCLSKYMRRGSKDLDVYFQVTGYGEPHEFDKGAVFHMQEPDLHQEIYGVPEYISALQSAWLNESSTLFRRKYYLNGSHAGYILYLTDSLNDETYVEQIRTALRDSKGPGNFRNLFMYAPGGKKDGLQIMPISEVAAKDEFFNIKNVTRDDILAAHRVPPQLLGIVPTTTAGFGAVVPAAKVFSINELLPLQSRFREVNEWAGEQLIDFGPYAAAEINASG